MINRINFYNIYVFKENKKVNIKVPSSNRRILLNNIYIGC